MIEDYTDKGTLWDPVLAAYSYSFNKDTQKFTPYDPGFPVNYLYFVGRWGDEAPPDDSEGQVEIFGQRKFVGGPTGPLDKRLVRENMSGIKGDDWIWPFLVV